MRIRNPETGELLATLAWLRQRKGWLVVTPDGLFDGSPRAWEHILWRFRGNTFEVAPGEEDPTELEAIYREMERQRLQRPRVLYRRDPEVNPLVIANLEEIPVQR